MKPVRPRALLHRGTVEAAAFLFDARLLGVAAARRRILSLWAPGAAVYRVEHGWLLRLPAPRRARCDAAPGLPLVALDGRPGAALAAAPLEPAEHAALAPPAGAMVLLRGGTARVVAPAEAERADPAAWLDVEGLAPVPVASLGNPPAPPRVLVEERSFAARERLEGVPPAAPELGDVLRALREANARREAGEGTGLGARAGGGLLGGAASWLQRLSATGASPPPGGAAGFSGMAKWAAARLLLMTQLSRFVGARQAQYLSRMMDLFERGDLREALRHAIPLGADGECGALPPFLGMPGPRDDLSIHPQRQPADSEIGLPPEWVEALRTRYRLAYRRLCEAGRFEEAAFVLAELLGEAEEAVALLERHGRLQLAAELAEGRQVPPGLIVRQWFVAGDRERAVRIARRTGAFADAVVRLERSDPQGAKVLRLLWAGALAEAGSYTAAVEAAWPVPEARPLVIEWMDRAIEIGGVPAARMLARKLELVPAAFLDLRRRSLHLLEDEGPDAAPERAEFARALLAGPRALGATTLARAAVRVLTRDASLGHERFPGPEFRRLVDFAGDGALRADVVPLPEVRRPLLAEREAPLTVTVDWSDTGTIPLFDAALLPGGGCLVALGEAGARLLARDGRTVAHFDQPAHRLVLADGGDRAIAVAPRGGAQRLARLDLRERRAASWCEAEIGAFAPDYDGSLWFVAVENEFLAVDATAAGLAALWRTRGVGRIAAIARSAERCSFLTHRRGDTDAHGRRIAPWERWERWNLALPGLTLRWRDEALPPDDGIPPLNRAVSAEGEYADLSMRTAGGVMEGMPGVPYLALTAYGERIAEWPNPHQWQPRGLARTGDWLAAPVPTEGGFSCHLFDDEQRAHRATVTLLGAARLTLRLTTTHLVLADDLGRLVVMDLASGRLVRDLRVR